MPAAGKQTKEPDPVAEEAPEELDLAVEDEFPAVGEAATFVEWDMERVQFFEYAGLITEIEPPSRIVSMVVFFPHSRAGRPMAGVPFRPEGLDVNPTNHWRYPEVSERFHVDEPEDTEDE